MKTSTLKLINEIRSVLALSAQLETRIPSLKKLNDPIQSLSKWLSTLSPSLLPPETLNAGALPVSAQANGAQGPWALCMKPADLPYTPIEQSILSSLIQEKLLLGISYLRASRDKALDPVFLLGIQERIDQKD